MKIKSFTLNGFYIPIVLLLWAVVFFMLIILPHPLFSFIEILTEKIRVLLILVLFLTISTAAGTFLIRRFFRIPLDAFTVCLGAGFGLGLYSLLAFLLGIIGLVNGLVYFLILAVAAVLFAKEMLGLFNYFKLRISVFFSDLSGLDWVYLILFSAFAIIYYLNASTPVFDYDALEYHLGCPAEYLKSGSIYFMKDNVYASFPANIEILYMAGLSWKIESFPKLLNYFLGILVFFAVYAITVNKYGKRAALLMGLSIYSSALFALLSSQAGVDIGTTFFSVLALGSLIKYNDIKNSRWALICGIFAGMALGCKYTAILILFIPILFALLYARAGYKHLFLFIFTAGFVVFPWLLRNLLNTSNPVFPLLGTFFKSSALPAEMARRFVDYHRPEPGLLNLFHDLYQNVIANIINSPLLLLFIPLFFVGKRGAIERLLRFYFVISLVLWMVFTVRDTRFLLPAIPAYFIVCLSSLARINLRSVHKRAFEYVIAAIIGVSLYIPLLLAVESDSMKYFLGIISQDEYLSVKLPPYEAFKFINERCDKSRSVILVGEARTYHLSHKLFAGTYFNETFFTDTLCEGISEEELYRLVLKNNAQYIMINFNEIGRMQLQGDRTYLAKIDWKTLEAFTNEYCILEFRDSKKHISVYRVKEVSEK